MLKVLETETMKVKEVAEATFKILDENQLKKSGSVLFLDEVEEVELFFEVIRGMELSVKERAQITDAAVAWSSAVCHKAFTSGFFRGCQYGKASSVNKKRIRIRLVRS